MTAQAVKCLRLLKILKDPQSQGERTANAQVMLLRGREAIAEVVPAASQVLRAAAGAE
jgi:hypothetical protein